MRDWIVGRLRGQMGDNGQIMAMRLQKYPTYRWELTCASIYCVIFVGAFIVLGLPRCQMGLLTR